MDFSFIIPAYNEAKNIEHIIASIRQFVPDVYKYEITVVDHGSSDDTVKLAQSCGAKTLVHSQGTVAGLRNYGVTHSSGDILVFLDADILLTTEWSSRISEVVPLLKNGERLLTGSRCGISDRPSWIEKYWFKPLEQRDNAHINSGHMIISRILFDELQGFDDKLETGEDYDISMRAKSSGIRMFNDVDLRVIHKGYPKTLGQFFKREYWHGKGDAMTFNELFKSKVAIASLLLVMLHLVLLYFGYQSDKYSAMAVLMVICLIVFSMTIIKYRNESLRAVLINSFIYYVYLWARGLSVISLPGFRAMRKRMR